MKTAKRIARAALAFAFGVLAAPFLPFALAFVVWEDDDL